MIFSNNGKIAYKNFVILKKNVIILKDPGYASQITNDKNFPLLNP